MQYVLFAGAVGVVFFTCAQLMTRNKQPIHYCMVLGCLCASYVVLYLWAREVGVLRRLPALAGTDAAATFLATPAFFLASLSVLYEGRKPVRSYAVFFIAPGALALATVVYDVLAASFFPRASDAAPFSSPARMALSLTANLAFLGAVCADLLAALRLHRAGLVRHRAGFRHQVVFLFLYLACALTMFVRFVLRDELPYEIAIAALCVVMIAFGLTRIAVSYFVAQEPARSVERKPRRPEWDASVAELSQRLEELMERDAPYRDEHLTLPALATRLGVEPLRLSYHLHAHLSTSFRRYINEWRLRAVRRDLVVDSARSILQIAFDNGFNSKSSFNTLFYNRYGETPREFRQRGAAPPSRPAQDAPSDGGGRGT